MAVAPAYHESLPYIDQEPSPEALAAARALISAESESQNPPPQEQQPTPSFSPAIQAELSRIASQQPPDPLDLSRYEAQEIPPPSSSSAASDPSALASILANASVSGTYLASRLQNLHLLDKWGKNAWLIGNAELEAELRAVEAELSRVKADIDVVNVQRRRRQEDVKAEVETMDKGWRDGVGRVLQTEIAVEELKAQIREELRRQSGVVEGQ